MHHPAETVGDASGLFLHEYLLQGRASRTAYVDRHVRRIEATGKRLVAELARQPGRYDSAGQLDRDLVRDELVGERTRGIAQPAVLVAECVHARVPSAAED